MAIKASGGNPPQNSLRFSEIENEFGQNSGRKIGNYRMNNLNIGALSEVSLSRDGCGISANSDIPVDNQTIRFSDFYSAKQNIIIDFHSNNQNRVNAKNDKFNASNATGNFTVVGGTNGNNGPKPSNTSGKKVIIHVTKVIGSAYGSVNNVALRTGTWNSGTEVLVEVDGGTIIGAGGKGGDGREATSGLPGDDGTSGLGIDYSGTKIQTTEGGLIACGFGGGGAGGGGETKREGNWRGSGRGPEVVVGGPGGGGGQGIPGGAGGAGSNGSPDGTAGSATAPGDGGEGISRTSRGEATINAGDGGEGGGVVNGAVENADAGTSSFLSGGEHENPHTTGGGGGGGNGAAIRKVSGINFTLIGSPTTFGATDQIGVS